MSLLTKMNIDNHSRWCRRGGKNARIREQFVTTCVCFQEVRMFGPWLATVTRQTVNYICHEGRQFTSTGPFMARDT